jgi:hypothetical protein
VEGWKGGRVEGWKGVGGLQDCRAGGMGVEGWKACPENFPSLTRGEAEGLEEWKVELRNPKWGGLEGWKLFMVH